MRDVQDWISVTRLHSRGVKIKQIARQLKMSKNTVKALLKKKIEPKYERAIYETKVDEYKEKIKEWYTSAEYDFIGTRIFYELQNIGYAGSIGPVYRYLKSLKDEKNRIASKATVRIETPMGDQAQFDWSEYKMVVDNEIRQVYCFSLIFASCRMKAITFSLKVDGDAIYEAIQELFEDLGGVTREILIDNPKALVIEHELGKEPKFNLDALRMAAHLGTELNACACYRARTKGKVERPFQDIEEHFVKGNTFSSMSELNERGKAFIRNWCKRIHGTTKRIPQEAHRDELQYLLPLPAKRFIANQCVPRKVSLDSLVSMNSGKYSVPVEYVDKQILCRVVYGFRLDIFDKNMKFITSHEEQNNQCDPSRKMEHYKDIFPKAPKSIPEIKRQFIKTFTNGAEYLEKASRLLDQPSYHARQLLKLEELYTVQSLDLVIGYCIDNNIFLIDDIKVILKEKYFDIIHTQETSISGDIFEILGTSSDPLVRALSYYEGGGQN